MTAIRGGARLSGPISASVLLHAAAIAVVAIRPATPPMPPLFSVELLAAPTGARTIGELRPAPPEPAAAPEPSPAPGRPTPPAPAKPRAPGKSVALAGRKPAKAARAKAAAPPAIASTKAGGAAAPSPSPSPAPLPPTPTKTAGAAAAGGPTGDKGSDVATVRTEGTAFPFPGYLSNIVRQIALNFRPRSPAASLKCEVAFLLHRDGSVTNLRFVSRSGSYAFDLEAQGAIEAAARSKSFGALPTDFADDVLPVTFSFDPRLVR